MKGSMRGGDFMGRNLIDAQPFLIIAELEHGFLYCLQASEENSVAPDIGIMPEEDSRRIINPPDGLNIFNEDSGYIEVYHKDRDEWLEMHAR